MFDLFQRGMIRLLSPFIPVSNRMSPKLRYRLITICFIIDIVLFCIVQGVWRKTNYFYNTCCGLFLLFALIFLSLDVELKRVHWRRSLCIIWFGMCITFTISDAFVVVKPTCGLGLILGIIFPMIFFVWQNHRRRDLLWKCLKDALKIAFITIMILSLLFRPYIGGGRYSAIFTNPNTFGLYLYLLFCVYMSDVDWFVETNRPLKKKLWSLIQLGIVVFYISISQARTALFAVIGIFVIWVICRLILNIRNHIYMPFVKNVVLLLGICALIYPCMFLIQTHVPDMVGHPVTFKEENVFMSNGQKVNRLELEEKKGQQIMETERNNEKKELQEENVLIRTIESFVNLDSLDRISTGRITIYKKYLNSLNWLGHKEMGKKINGHQVSHAHNNWIQIGYTYGIGGLFFYSLLTLLCLAFSLKFYITECHRRASYAFLPLAIIIGYLIATMTECFITPFDLFPAFAFWFACCDLFIKKVPKNGDCHE